MSFVEKMTLFGDSRSEKEENITPNKEPIKGKKIFSHTLEPSTLRLDTNYGSTLYLKLCEDSNKALYFEANLKYSETSGCPKIDHFGYSANVFPDLYNELKIMSHVLHGTSIRFYYNLIILGRIYEAVCKSGFSMDDIEFDRDMLNSFVNKSLEFYGYNDYIFDYIAAIKSISSHTLSNDGFILDRIVDRSKEFNIGDKKGILGYNETSIYLRMDKDSLTESLLSLGIPIMDVSEETSSSIREALAWILLSSKGYYVHNQEFVDTSLDYDNAIPNSDFEGKQQITPDNFAQCFKQS
ncbi:hypothetical protein [Thomasclavelia cocleata]|uniref:hypothetical protein n=1 Tax=Thomasclavelia cocleata TaxID=69824 RepID=UPI00272DF47F|nr:hypothetical protein [Thomasclavelia cocleata]